MEQSRSRPNSAPHPMKRSIYFHWMTIKLILPPIRLDEESEACDADEEPELDTFKSLRRSYKDLTYTPEQRQNSSARLWASRLTQQTGRAAGGASAFLAK